jgi:ABC-2 type transport system permease protein
MAVATPPAAEASVPDVGTSTTQVLKLARYQFRDYLRSRRYILMMVIVGIIGFILTAVVAYFRPTGLVGLASDNLAFYGSFWGGGATVIIVFAGVIFGGDAIAGEFQNKTGYFLMGLPIRRTTIYIGKYLAALAASFTAVVVFLLILLGNGIYYFGGSAFPWQLGESFALSLVYMLALLGATFLFSSLFKTSTYATLVVAVLFLFGFSIIQALVSDLVKIEPWFILSYASSILGSVFDNPYPAHVVTTTLQGMGPRGGTITTTTYTATVVEGVAIMLGYFVLTTLLGLLIFEREEFT